MLAAKHPWMSTRDSRCRRLYVIPAPHCFTCRLLPQYCPLPQRIPVRFQIRRYPQLYPPLGVIEIEALGAQHKVFMSALASKQGTFAFNTSKLQPASSNLVFPVKPAHLQLPTFSLVFLVSAAMARLTINTTI